MKEYTNKAIKEFHEILINWKAEINTDKIKYIKGVYPISFYSHIHGDRSFYNPYYAMDFLFLNDLLIFDDEKELTKNG